MDSPEKDPTSTAYRLNANDREVFKSRGGNLRTLNEIETTKAQDKLL